jgi:ABC-type transport system substrate-binding protein
MTEAGIESTVFLPDFTTLLLDWFGGRSNFAFFAYGGLNPESPAGLLYSLFHSESPTNMQQRHRYVNPDFDAAIEACLDAPTADEAAPHCKDAQFYLFEDQPIIPLYNNIFISAFRTDKWTGWVNYNGEGINEGFWNENHVRLKEGEPERRADGTGGLFRRILESDISVFNLFIDNKGVFTVTAGNLFDTLYARNPYSLEKIPWFAESWTTQTVPDPAYEDDIFEITLNLIDNATWHDGREWNAWDVPLHYFLVQFTESPILLAPDLVSFINVTVVDDYTVKMYSEASGHLEFVNIAGNYWTGTARAETWAEAANYGKSGFTAADVRALIQDYASSDWDTLVSELTAMFEGAGVTPQEILAFDPGRGVDQGWMVGTGFYQAKEFNYGNFYSVEAYGAHPYSVRAERPPTPPPPPPPPPGPTESGVYNPVTSTGETFDPLAIDLAVEWPYSGSTTMALGLGVVALIVGVAIGIAVKRRE